MRPVVVRARAPRRRDRTTSVLRRSRPTRRATVISPKKLRSIRMVLRLIGKKYYVESGGLSPVASPEDFGRQVVRNERPRGQTLALRGHDEVEAIALSARSRDSPPPPHPSPPKTHGTRKRRRDTSLTRPSCRTMRPPHIRARPLPPSAGIPTRAHPSAVFHLRASNSFITTSRRCSRSPLLP